MVLTEVIRWDRKGRNGVPQQIIIFHTDQPLTNGVGRMDEVPIMIGRTHNNQQYPTCFFHWQLGTSQMTQTAFCNGLFCWIYNKYCNGYKLSLWCKEGVEPVVPETKTQKRDGSDTDDNGKQIGRRSTTGTIIERIQRLSWNGLLEKERIKDDVNGERSIGTINLNSITKLKRAVLRYSLVPNQHWTTL